MQVGCYRVLDEKLGEGNHGSVQLAKSIQDDSLAAIKIIENNKKIQSEIDVLNQISNHPGVCKLIKTECIDKKMYMILEYVNGGDMLDYIMKYGCLCEKACISLFKQIVDTVAFLHCNNIVHHDLKLENVMINNCEGKMVLKLIDFGYCARIASNKRSRKHYLTQFSGTPQYSAPEILNGQPYDGFPIDIYALGIILYIMLVGEFPFNGDDMADRWDQQNSAAYLASLEKKYPEGVSKDVKYLILRMLDPSPETRISIEEVRRSSVFNQAGMEDRANTNSLEESIGEDC